MSPADFSQIETKVDQLLEHLAQLKTENYLLRKRLNQSQQDASRLHEKTQHAKHNIRALLTEMKEKLA